jgi:hypothetical protein
LWWTGCGETGFRDFVPTAAGAHLVVGRHGACDVVVGGDQELSLRHLIVLPARSAAGEATAPPARPAGGGPALRLVDLRAAIPMYLDDEVPQRALLAEGAFAIRLGRYVLGGFPIGPGQGSPPHDPPRSERVDASRPVEVAAGEGPYRSIPGRAKSVITMLPRPITMVDAVVGARPEDPIGLLGAARGGERVRIAVGRPSLRAGVLVGRADKCTDEGLRPLLTIRVSRVHVVVIEVDGKTMLYDCASTNGVFVEGRRVRSLELISDGPVVQLAGRDGIELRWSATRR